MTSHLGGHEDVLQLWKLPGESPPRGKTSRPGNRYCPCLRIPLGGSPPLGYTSLSLVHDGLDLQRRLSESPPHWRTSHLGIHSGLERSRSDDPDGNCHNRVRRPFPNMRIPQTEGPLTLGWSSNSGGWSGVSEISVLGWNLLFTSVKCPGMSEICVHDRKYLGVQIPVFIDLQPTIYTMGNQEWWYGSFDPSSFISSFIPATVRSPNTMIAPSVSLRKCL